MAGGADRHHHFAAIDNRRHDESGEFWPVHHVDRNLPRLRPFRNLPVDGIARRGNHHRGTFEIEFVGGAGKEFDARFRFEIFGRRVPAHIRARCPHQPQFIAERVAAAGQQNIAAGEIDEDWKEAHGEFHLTLCSFTDYYVFIQCKYEKHIQYRVLNVK